MTAPTSRCVGCGDPAPHDWRYCLQCHAWNDLYLAVCSGPGLDEFRLRRARQQFARRSPRESVRALLEKLTRRVAELEAALL